MGFNSGFKGLNNWRKSWCRSTWHITELLHRVSQKSVQSNQHFTRRYKWYIVYNLYTFCPMWTHNSERKVSTNDYWVVMSVKNFTWVDITLQSWASMNLHPYLSQLLSDLENIWCTDWSTMLMSCVKGDLGVALSCTGVSEVAFTSVPWNYIAIRK